MFWPVKLAELGASLAINAYQTLKLLALKTDFYFESHSDPLYLSLELRFIPGNNIFEELELGVEVLGDASWLTEFEDWSAFDSVLTESGAFRMLHRVSVQILWHPIYRDLGKQEAILKSLKEDKFPRLLESKAVW